MNIHSTFYLFNTFLGLVAGLALRLNLSLVARVEDCLALPVAHLGQTGSLSLVEVSRGCALIGWIMTFVMPDLGLGVDQSTLVQLFSKKVSLTVV